MHIYENLRIKYPKQQHFNKKNKAEKKGSTGHHSLT